MLQLGVAPCVFVLVDWYDELQGTAACSSAVLCAGAAAEDTRESICCLEMAFHRPVF